jgi:hypothetical protein
VSDQHLAADSRWDVGIVRSDVTALARDRIHAFTSQFATIGDLVSRDSGGQAGIGWRTRESEARRIVGEQLAPHEMLTSRLLHLAVEIRERD